MSKHAEAIFSILDSLRGSKRHSNPSLVIEECQKADIPFGVDELRFVILQLGRGYCDNYLPAGVAEFIGKLLTPYSPKRILDPWAGVGFLDIPVYECVRPATFLAVSPTVEGHQIIQTWKGSSEISCLQGEPQSILAASGDVYDAVVSCPPFGMQARQPITVRVGRGCYYQGRIRESCDPAIMSCTFPRRNWRLRRPRQLRLASKGGRCPSHFGADWHIP